jgi:hypothetical protein
MYSILSFKFGKTFFMDAVFRLKASEFDESFFSQVKSIIKANKDVEITISITDTGAKGILRNESRDEYFSRLDKSIANLEKGQIITYTPEGFDDFSRQLLNEP